MTDSTADPKQCHDPAYPWRRCMIRAQCTIKDRMILTRKPGGCPYKQEQVR